MTGDGEELGTGRGAGPLAAVNLANVHLDELPAYEGPGMSNSTAPQTSNTSPQPTSSRPEASQPSRSTVQRHSGVVIPPEEDHNQPTSNQASSNETFEPPTGPPPGYEEVQQQSVASELERRLRRASED